MNSRRKSGPEKLAIQTDQVGSGRSPVRGTAVAVQLFDCHVLAGLTGSLKLGKFNAPLM